MTEQERDNLLRGLSPTEQLIYSTMTANGGPMTAPMLRGPVRRNDGLTSELRHMSELGLIKPMGKKSIAGNHPAMVYRLVALPDVEKARERFAVRGPRRRRRRRPGDPGIDQMREMGVRPSMDDTGAGFASLAHILKLVPDFIKLDRELTSGIDHDQIRLVLATAS